MSKFATLNEAFFSKPVHFAQCPLCGHINTVSGDLPPVVTCSHPLCKKQFEAVEFEEEDNDLDEIWEAMGGDENDDWGY